MSNHPEAICARKGYAHRHLVFSRSEVTRWGWSCTCPDCPQEARTVGTGRSHHEALSEYARACGVRLADIELTGEQHV